MFTRSTNNIYQVIEQLPELGWRHNKTYFLATKTGVPKDDRYLISWVGICIRLEQSISFFLSSVHMV